VTLKDWRLQDPGRGPLTAAGEADFCPCGGAYVSRRGRPGRSCGACGGPEPEPLVRVTMPSGALGWVPLSEIRSGRWQTW
jgi:hypothetical protein